MQTSSWKILRNRSTFPLILLTDRQTNATNHNLLGEGNYARTCPDIACDELVVPSDGHLLTTGVGDFQQSSEVGVYVVREVVELYSGQQIDGGQVLSVPVEYVHLQHNNNIDKMKKCSERRKHCALAVARRSQKFSPRRRPLPGGAGWPKFNKLEMVTTFTYKPSMVKIDARNFELSW